jgi:hypothetical protein
MKFEELKSGYEYVFTVIEYHDGPRKGVANLGGAPHSFECIFSETKDDYTEVFYLTALDSESFQLAIEDWEIWQGWEFAFHKGDVDVGTHPALPDEAIRQAELKGILDKVLVTDPIRAIQRIGKFEVLGATEFPKGVIRPLQVKWVLPPH